MRRISDARAIGYELTRLDYFGHARRRPESNRLAHNVDGIGRDLRADFAFAAGRFSMREITIPVPTFAERRAPPEKLRKIQTISAHTHELSVDLNSQLPSNLPFIGKSSKSGD